MMINNCQDIIYNELIDSDAAKACKEVKAILERIQLSSGIETDQMFDIKVILCELIQNAIQHGNNCDINKKICVNVWLQENNRVLGITVKDQGCGFDPLHTMDLKSSQIPVCNPIDMDEYGRGLFIVKNLCEYMEFNTSGNAITVTKRL